MPIVVSDHLMMAMGFESFASGRSLTASFMCTHVYEPRGLTIPTNVTCHTYGVVAGVNYRLAVSGSVNDGSRSLNGDSYVEDEDKWKKDKKCSGPFVLIELGPTPEYTIKAGYLKTEEDGSVTTYESFPSLRTDLAAMERSALPLLVTSLNCTLGAPDVNLELKKIDRASWGRTPTGQTVHDIRLEVTGSATVSRGLPEAQLHQNLVDSTALATKLNGKAAKFFALGLGEVDELKRFLYFFLALEIETHASFGRVDHAAAVQSLLDPSSAPRPTTTALLGGQVTQLRGLLDRFTWCSATCWQGVSDADIDTFKQLKTARDDIAHGSSAKPPEGYSTMAQRLAQQVLRA